jgi:hypothetical protein
MSGFLRKLQRYLHRRGYFQGCGIQSGLNRCTVSTRHPRFGAREYEEARVHYLRHCCACPVCFACSFNAYLQLGNFLLHLRFGWASNHGRFVNLAPTGRCALSQTCTKYVSTVASQQSYNTQRSISVCQGTRGLEQQLRMHNPETAHLLAYSIRSPMRHAPSATRVRASQEVYDVHVHAKCQPGVNRRSFYKVVPNVLRLRKHL